MASPYRTRDREQPVPMGKIAALAAPPSNPPFGHQGRTATAAEVIAANQPPDWPPVYMRGGKQPYEQGRIAALVTTAFNPTSLITGAGGFWRADMGTHVTSTKVTQWDDQSSFGKNLAQSNGSLQPTFGATSFNTSFPGITFVSIFTGAIGTNLNNTAMGVSSTTLSVFLLYTQTGQTSSNAVAWNFNDGADYATTPNVQGGSNWSVAGGGTWCYTSGFRGNAGNIAINDTLNSPSLVGIVFDGANATTWSAGAAAGTPTAFSSTLGSNNWMVGSGLAGGNATWGGVMAFVGVTQKAINSTDWGNLKTWSNSNWGTSF